MNARSFLSVLTLALLLAAMKGQALAIDHAAIDDQAKATPDRFYAINSNNKYDVSLKGGKISKVAT